MSPSSDPRFTAYALGELSEAERAAFEAEILKSEEARAEVAELERAAELLKSEFEKDEPAVLADLQRKRIEAATRSGGAKVSSIVEARPSLVKRVFIFAAPLAVAAGVVAVLYNGTSKEDRSASVEHDYQGKAASSAYARSPMATATANAAAPMATSYASAAPGEAKKVKAKKDENGAMRMRDSNPNIPAPAPLPENPFVDIKTDKQSTFSIDVDTASYSMIRKLLETGQRPEPGLVRIEEMVNYFHYAYPEPDDAAFSVMADTASAPWATGHRLVRIGLKGKTVEMKKRKSSNLVFLIDTSGSMQGPDRLGLLKKGFSMLVEQLDERDSVSIVAYAGSSGLVLEPTPGNERRKILDAIERLTAGGSTNGGQGIQLAYQTAKKGFIEGGVNRVILATDGDFNVGVTSRSDLQSLIEEKAKTGVFLSVLGFGTGNTRDATMETLADKGNGNYAYIDSDAEARKVFVEQASGTLVTIAKDVKIQVTFDPKLVQSFRLIGYENRVMAHEDFANDKKDAGEIGAGHTVTALYEIVPAAGAPKAGHLADISLRYKEPDGATSRLVQTSVDDKGASFSDASTDFRFAASVAGFGMLLRGSENKGDLSYASLLELARGATGDDKEGYRREMVRLIEKASALAGQ